LDVNKDAVGGTVEQAAGLSLALVLETGIALQQLSQTSLSAPVAELGTEEMRILWEDVGSGYSVGMNVAFFHQRGTKRPQPIGRGAREESEQYVDAEVAEVALRLWKVRIFDDGARLRPKGGTVSRREAEVNAKDDERRDEDMGV
jgi:hypothetical protein